MNTAVFRALFCVATLWASASAQIVVAGFENQRPTFPEPDAATKLKWLQEYLHLIEKLPAGEFARGYPALIEKLGKAPEERVPALKAIGELGDPSAIPFLVPVLRNGERSSQVYAGLAIEKIVSGLELSRRGSPIKGEEFIEAPKAGELDLKPMRWIVFEMLTCGEPSIQGYAVTMAGYLDLEELKPVLEVLRSSPHGAVKGQLDDFLHIMERSKR
ncbi:hypothetical protein [Luteolibacter soli]|uniref:HEAT repeat domain-containing protein n=1 Tax=Luteolibacter soli TaxID=3135280 RepID=A0ABU9AWB6_9BACT